MTSGIEGMPDAGAAWTKLPVYDLLGVLMNVSLVNSVPHGEFAEISVLTNGWQNRFQTLVSQHRPIKFDFYPMPDLPLEVHRSVRERGYRDVVVQQDQWQHFFIPEQIQNS